MRVSPEDARRLDRLMSRIQTKYPLPVSKSEVLRAVIRAGLAVLERQDGRKVRR